VTSRLFSCLLVSEEVVIRQSFLTRRSPAWIWGGGIGEEKWKERKGEKKEINGDGEKKGEGKEGICILPPPSTHPG